MSASETKTVLYVEDNPINIFLVQAIFESRDHVRLLTAMRGAIGLDVARQHHPDLILLDLNLPDMDGAEYLQALRADQATAQIPVVIVSGDSVYEQHQHFSDLGVLDFITKPFDISQFETTVDRCLNIAGDT